MDQNTRVRIITISRIVAAFVFLMIAAGIMAAILLVPTHTIQYEVCRQVFEITPSLGFYTVVAIGSGVAAVLCLFMPNWGYES